MKRPPSSGPDIKIDLDKPRARRAPKTAGGKSAPAAGRPTIAQQMTKKIASEFGKQIGDLALEKLGLKKAKKAAKADEKAVRKAVEKESRPRKSTASNGSALSTAAAAMGRAGRGITHVLSDLQRRAAGKRLALARKFRWPSQKRVTA